MIKIIFILFIPLLGLTCSVTKNIVNNGSALYKTTVYNLTLKQLVIPAYSKDRKHLFKDSLIIAEGFGVNIITINGKETSSVYTDRYTFMDLRTKSFYVYKNFSDTASIQLAYNLKTKNRPSDGWVLSAKSSTFSSGQFVSLPDTLIDQVKYKRIKMNEKKVYATENNFGGIDSVESDVINIGYLRCDNENLLISLDWYVSKKMGCPVVRTDFISPSHNSLWVTEIEFLSQKLTHEEEKVFAAWEKNAKNNPVINK